MNKLCIASRKKFHCTSPDIRGIAIDGVGITKDVAGLLTFCEVLATIVTYI